MKSFKIKYNIISAFNVFVAALISFLIYQKIGINDISDTYFIGINIYSFMCLVSISFVEQFQLKSRQIARDKTSLSVFIYTFLIFSLVISICFYILASETITYVIDVFLHSNRSKYQNVEDFTTILYFSLIVYLPTQVVLLALNTTNKIGLSSILQYFPNYCTCLYLVGIEKVTLNDVAFYYVLGTYLSLIIGLVLLRNQLILFRFDYSIIHKTIVDGLKIRMSNNIHNLFMMWALSYFPSLFGSGSISIFSYAKKISDTTLSVIFLPVYKVLSNRIVDMYIGKKFFEIVQELKNIDRYIPIIYFFCFLLICLASYLLSSSLVNKGIIVSDFLGMVFLLLMANALISLETAYGIVNLINVNYKTIICANIGFIIIFLFVFYTIGDLLEVTKVALAICTGQISNFLINRKRALTYLREQKNV